MKFRIEKNCTSQKDYVTNEFEESFFERLYDSLAGSGQVVYSSVSYE